MSGTIRRGGRLGLWLLPLLIVGVSCRSLSPEERAMKAQRLYEEAVALHEEGRVDAEVKGVGLEDNRKFARSLDRFRDAAALAPDYLQLRFDLGRALYAEGQAYQDRQSLHFEDEGRLRGEGKEEEADAALERALGLRDRAQARFREAVPHFEKVVNAEVRPREMAAQAYYYLGWLHTFLNELEPALRSMKKARGTAELAPEDAGKLEKAIKLIEDELIRQRMEGDRAVGAPPVGTGAGAGAGTGAAPR